MHRCQNQLTSSRLYSLTLHRKLPVCLFLSLLSLGFNGCLGVENRHFVVEQSGANEMTIKVAGQVTDQITRLWEQRQFNAFATLQTLSDMTQLAPIRIVNSGGLNGLTWTGDQIWEAAILADQEKALQQALEIIYLNISDYTLGIQIGPNLPNDPHPNVRWIVCNRDFVGMQVLHVNLIPETVPVRVRADGEKLVYTNTGKSFVPWGVQYTISTVVDGQIQLRSREELLDDFSYVASLGCNCVRIHVEYFRVMKTQYLPDPEFLTHLEMVVDVAGEAGIYLDVTGLDCYWLEQVPAWYHELDEAAHWDMQARYWAAVSRVCAGKPAVLFYDLINEPVISGGAFNPDYPWIVDSSFGGYYFLQRLVQHPNGRTGKEIARAWIDKMVGTIRQHDPDTMISLGAIAWGLKFPNYQPVFYDPDVAENLDIVCIHHYPDNDPVANAVIASRVSKYEIGKPIIIEEIFPLYCSLKVFSEFIDDSLTAGTDGWISYYAGFTIDELKERGGIADYIQWTTLEYLRDNAERIYDAAK